MSCEGGVSRTYTTPSTPYAVTLKKKSKNSANIYHPTVYGTLIISHNETLRATVDAEAHAVAAILHDLGWDQTPKSTVISADRRFEVDGAIAARDFIHSHAPNPKAWDDHRVQLVWDSIALHTQQSIYMYKEDNVAVTGLGILTDFTGPTAGVTQQEYDAVIAAYPKTQFKEGVNETFIWLCQTKPSTTWGELHPCIPLSPDMYPPELFVTFMLCPVLY